MLYLSENGYLVTLTTRATLTTLSDKWSIHIGMVHTENIPQNQHNTTITFPSNIKYKHPTTYI